MKTIADIAMKPFSSEHLCQHLKVLETLNCFSTNTGPSWQVLTLKENWKTRTFQGLRLKDKDKGSKLVLKDKDQDKD